MDIGGVEFEAAYQGRDVVVHHSRWCADQLAGGCSHLYPVSSFSLCSSAHLGNGKQYILNERTACRVVVGRSLLKVYDVYEVKGSTTMNESTTTTSTTVGMTKREEEFLRFAVMAMVLTMMLALLGNGFLVFIIRSIAGSKPLNSIQILILNNCVADMLFALLTILPTCVQMVTSKHIGNDLSCRAVAYVRLVPMYASPFLLVAISFDRFLVSGDMVETTIEQRLQAICRPWSTMKRRTHLHARSYAATAWFFALLFASPNWLIYELREFPNGARFCTAKFAPTSLHNRLYVTYFSVLAWVVPSVISGLLYTAVCRCVWTELTGVRRTIARSRKFLLFFLSSFTISLCRSEQGVDHQERTGGSPADASSTQHRMRGADPRDRTSASDDNQAYDDYSGGEFPPLGTVLHYKLDRGIRARVHT